ncbi:RNA polymerase sigma factor [Sphaerimonospora mesophila]|uniref:RNA polymerase sigma factor n=1 Tax=Sphaerimonospora mesophila TaxID=37483 RepID=UPI0006E2752A
MDEHHKWDDPRLLRAIADGDRRALEVIYARHAPWLVIRLTRRCADQAVVDEAVQDTFVAIWRTARTWTGRGEVAAWIWGIGVRRLLDLLRKKPHVMSPILEPTMVSAEDQVLLGIEYGELGRALDTLSPELRAVVQATVLDGLTTREAGKLLGIPAGTVKTRMMRAKSLLREELA